MNDGIFPEIYSPSLFNLKEHQPSEDDTLIEQRYLFYQTLCTTEKEAYIIWHTGSDDKKSEMMRSQFADALEEVVPFAEITRESQDSQVFSSNEFFRYVGLAKNTSSQAMSLAKEKGLDEESLETLQQQIPHSIIVEKKRAETASSEYSGVLPFDLLTETEREVLLKFQNRVYSISQLETYAACPFKFFSKYILHLESGLQTEGEEGLSGAERGTVLHETLYQILSGMRDRNEDIRSLSDEDFHRIGAEILSQNRSGKIRTNHPFWRLDKETVFEPPEPGIGMLQKFIEAERKYSAFITKPSFFEATFGMPIAEDKRDKTLYREDHVEISGIKLRGKIDRIDMDADAGIFSVTDYKSGKSASHKEIASGLSLQLPLYLRIAEDLLRAHLGDESMSGVAAVYHTLLGKDSKQQLALGLHEFAGMAFEGHKKGGQLKGEVDSVEALKDVIDTTVAYAKSYVEGIMKGSFPLVKEENVETACKYCEFKQVCRVREALENGALR
jgi:ATP-dependent helicase/DNAse subunit B